MITRRQMLGGIGTVAAASVAISILGVKPLAARNAEYTGKTHGADYFTNVVLMGHMPSLHWAYIILITTNLFLIKSS